MSDATPDNNLVITRIFDAPPELVYRAFVDPDQLSQWFGPVGWSAPRDMVDVDTRVGGYQRFTIVSDTNPEDRSVIDATFEEIIENRLLVGMQKVDMTDADFDSPVELRLRLEFHDEPGGKTRLVLTQGPYSEDVENMAREGWGSSFTKLDELLAAG